MARTFITATGTDIGKTFVTCLLIKTARKMGLTIHGLKPVISGFDENDIAASDSGQILQAMSRPLDMENVRAISPWRFSAPLSPDMAAKREGSRISLDELTAFCRRQPADPPLLIEGVGGVMVPLNETETTLDWQAALEAPCLLVTGSHLGTLSHTLTALKALESRRIAPSAIIVNSSETAPVPEQETADTLAGFTDGIPIYIIPRDAGEAPEALVQSL